MLGASNNNLCWTNHLKKNAQFIILCSIIFFSDSLPTHSRKPLINSALSSSSESLRACTSTSTESLSSRQLIASEWALFTPRDRCKCPICRCKLFKLTVSASAKPRRPTPEFAEKKSNFGNWHGSVASKPNLMILPSCFVIYNIL